MLLEESLYKIIDEVEGTIGLYFEDLATGKKVIINPDVEFSAASTIKIPLVTLLFLQAKEGLFNLNDQINIAEGNRVGGAGVIKELDQGYHPTIMDLAKLAIILSDNIATNQLIDIVGGPEKVTEFCKSLGLNNTKLQRKMMDIESLMAGKDNITTPMDMGLLLKDLSNGVIDSPEICNSIIDIMKAQQLNLKLPYLIPALEPDDPDIYNNVVKEGTVVVAHKTGELDKVQHDVGIFILPNDHRYILAIYTSQLKSDDEGIKAIAKLSKVVYDNVVGDAKT